MRKLVVLPDTDEKKWAEALLAARQILATGAKPHRTAPDYEGKVSISQEQHRLKRADVEALLSDYRSGMSTYQLAAKWQLHRHTVTAVLDRNGVKQRSYAAKITEAEITEAQALRADGWSVNALARRYGIAPGTMKKRLVV